MNKSAIQKFAIWARTELIAQVSQKAYQYGITEEGYGEANAVTVGGRALSSEEAKQRRELVAQIHQKGYAQVMEEVAYIWFNRFIALRFMEVNNYLPTHIRVFSDSIGAFKPEILSDALHLDLPGLDKDKVAAYIESNQTEDLYRYLLLTQCNALNEALPRMFEKMGGYTELLFPNNILKADSVLGRMVTDIPEEDWTDQVQIIGWLYQYYNSELKDDTFALLKKNVKITKERIPSATQLFTPDWIVRYMVENSLGRLWIEGHPDDELKSGWKYYLDEAEQEPEVQKQLDAIHAEYATLKPQDIKVIDPCMGSGHILVYAFDVLIQIYKKYGVSERDAAQNILQNNLYGLDIDDRAAQLAYFAVMMKARQYDRRIFSRGIQPHVYAIVESNGLDSGTIDYFTNNDPKLKKDFGTLVDELRDAKEYGSILNITPVDFAALYARVEEVREDISLYRENVLNTVLPLIQVAEVMAQKYDIITTNPPFMSGSGMELKLLNFIQTNYKDEKADIYACFITKALNWLKSDGLASLITMETWMFLNSMEKMRQNTLRLSTIVNMVHMPYLGKGGTSLGINFGTAAYVLLKQCIPNHCAEYNYVRYYECTDEGVPLSFPLENERHCFTSQNVYDSIPSNPVAYWVSSAMSKTFSNVRIGSQAISDGQTKTGDNTRFLRFFWEVNNLKIGKENKWAFIAKGGNFRRWYGNIEYVIDWSLSARQHYRKDRVARIAPEYIWFREGVSWNHVTSIEQFAARYLPSDMLFETAAPSIFFNDRTTLLWVIGYLNSIVSEKILKLINPTMCTNVGDVTTQPMIRSNSDNDIISLVNENISISKSDWDSYEVSWHFLTHPLVSNISNSHQGDVETIENYVVNAGVISEAYKSWCRQCEMRFFALQKNEEILNRIFLGIYGLQDELSSEVADKNVTVHRIFETKDDVPESMQGSNYVRTKRDEIAFLISYAVGCMFGRYSLDMEGLAYAGGEWDASRYSTIIPDKDNIIPICDDDYFDDDITGRFVKWVEAVYGSDTLEENLKFIADALGGKGTPRKVIRGYFLNDFYADHCKTYQKRPIYWLFDSGKKNGFKALIYMHRYQSDLLARMRTDYVHEQQERYRTQLTHIADALEHASGSERVKLTKQQKKLQDQSLEIQKYEEKIHHLADQNISIDLDDGVKHNYALFADVLAKIK